MFLPYSTDAPIYYWPIATVGIIAVNVFIFFAMMFGGIQNPEEWLLVYGVGLTPKQWLLSTFMHGNIFHLLGNMVFLWVFGMVVEGKLGWQKFLLCYLAVAVLQPAVEQTLQMLLGGVGGSLGASSAIYGIMAMAAIWAPKNEVSMFYWVLGIVVGTGEVPIMMLVGFYVGYDLLFTFFLGLNSSSWLHVGGVLIGAPLGIVLLKFDVVDCEGWDIFHVWRDDYGRKLSGEKPDIEAEEEHEKRRQLRESQILEEGREQIATYLKDQNPNAALALQNKLTDMGHDLQLSRNALLQLATSLHAQQKWAESCPLMAEVLDRFPEENNDAIRVKMAQICVVGLDRPGRALDLLQTIELQELPPELLKLAHKIAHRAKQMQQEGVVELDDEGW